MSPILITGATGLIGGEIARQLVARSMPIRILVRDASKTSTFDESVEVAVGDFSNVKTLAEALSGVERMFLATYDRPEIAEHQANVLTVAKRCGVQHVVRMSTAGIDDWRHLPTFHWHGICERQLEESGLGFTHLRPTWVMQNFDSHARNNVIRLPAGDGRTGFVDARDIAAVAVEALTAPGHEGKSYLLSSEILSHSEIAGQLTQATGRAVTYEDISPEIYEREMKSSGCPQTEVETMLGLYADIRAGTNCDAIVTDTVETVLARASIKFRTFAQDFAAKI